MEMSYAEITMFPKPFFEIKYLKEYKENVIFIPTERKIKDEDEIERIPCLFKKNQNSKNILIIFHCNGTDIFETFKAIHNFSEQYNINILIPEYPGYSIYDYSPLSSEKCLENSLIIYDFILNNIKNIKEENIYILGRSLGTGPAIYLASKRNPAGTFLISPYTTFAAVAEKIHNEEELKALSKHFRSIDYIDKINSPLLIIHGKIDKLINCNEAVILYEKCRKDIIKEINLVNDMTHNFDYFLLKDKIIPLIEKFVDKYCPIKNSLENDKNKIIIDFSKELYTLPDELKQYINSEDLELDLSDNDIKIEDSD
jgi:esterase/lipase